VPAGLDGDANPISSPQRDEVLDEVVRSVLVLAGPRVIVGIDGRSGSGKSTFADEVTARLERAGRTVLRSTTDSFHRPRAERMRLGPTSAQGYYVDSHQLDTIATELLAPFASGAAQVRVAAFDEPSDSAVDVTSHVPSDAVLVFDGLFVHRPELAGFWDLSVLLVADVRREREWLEYLESDLPSTPIERTAELDRRLTRARWPRYRDGWRLYVDTDRPDQVATMIVDNDDIEHPRVIRAV
jgi:uridine kinase